MSTKLGGHIVFQVPRRSFTSPLLKSLHWLPFDKRVKFKTLLYIFKVLNGLSPVYLSDCIAIYVPSRKGLCSDLDTNHLVVPWSKKNGLVMDPSICLLPNFLEQATTTCLFITHCWYIQTQPQNPLFLVQCNFTEWMFLFLCSLRLLILQYFYKAQW